MFEQNQAALSALGAQITTSEIKQQPKLWQEALKNYKEQKPVITEFLEKVKKESDKKIRIIFTGAGTSQYVGDTIVPYLNKKGDNQHFTFESIATTDIVGAPLEYLRKDEVTVLVSFARSGNSPESLAAVDLVNQLVETVYHITITCAPDGQLAQAAKNEGRNLLLLMPEGSNDQGFAMTGSFSCMTLTGLLVFDVTEIEVKETYISALVNMGEEVIQRENEILELIGNQYQRIVYLGSGSLSGLTREAQLKVLELTAGKIATVFDSSLGFRHGPKSFVDEKTIVFVFVSNDPYTRKYDNDILTELARDEIAEAVISINQAGSKDNDQGNHFTFNEKKILLPDAYLALPYVMFAQTVALNSSIQVKNTPDTPSATGSVNRVVKGVTIHRLTT